MTDRLYKIEKNEHPKKFVIPKDNLHESVDLENINADTFCIDKNKKPIWFISNNKKFNEVINTQNIRDFSGGGTDYDQRTASLFILLVYYGMREHHKVLDIGAGGMGLGRLLMPWLQKGNYYAIEPVEWVWRKGLEDEIGNDILRVKEPTIFATQNFEFELFNVKFDYVIASSVFSHAHPVQIKTCMKNLKNYLAPNGYFLASYVQGDVDSFYPGWVYPGINIYTKESIHGWIREEGFEVKDIEVQSHQIWLEATHQKL